MPAEETKMTRNEKLVLGRLEAANGPLSAYGLLDLLRDDGFRAPLQVYRALDGLMRAGLVHRLESLNAFVACAGPHDHGQLMTAFAICDGCGQVEELSNPLVGDALDGMIGPTGFAARKAVIEFRGMCARCRAAN
jgi:Fur family zinc uptake transcriptional regulator